MKVQVLGCSHQTSSLAVRERLAFGPDEARVALNGLRREFPNTEAVLLSTCNRVELYTATLHGDAPTRQQIAQFFADFHRLDVEEIVHRLYNRHGRESVRHLFLVASSLDSMVVGEAQISSQVKLAYQLATQQKSTGPLTHAVFQAATHVARRIANETAIHEHRVSIASVAVDQFVREVFERLDNKHALVIGAGQIAEETLRYLTKERIGKITIVNRRRERAEELAARFGACAADWTHTDELLTTADLVISATGAGRPIIDSARFDTIRGRRDGRTLVVLDLAVPRDFAPEIGQRPGVYLYSVDDLRAASERNRRRRESELPKALRVVEEETNRFMTDLNFREVAPVIEQLQQSWEQPKEAELDRLLKKLPNLDESAQQEIRRSFDRLTNKLFHPPVASLRKESRDGVPTALIESLVRLFRFGT